jgi:uncharacterized protein YeaO (DUF488 family)
MPHLINIKRAYEEASPDDGFRILVDRLWPRGVSKEVLKLDRWFKDIAPSNEVRKAFGHVPERYEAFRSAYLKELNENPASPDFLALVREELKKRPVTLVYSAKDQAMNQAVVLAEWLEEHG